MDIADKLQQLSDMHRQGQLTDAEFAQAKQSLLNTPAAVAAPASGDSLGSTLRDGFNIWIKYRIIMGVIGAVIFLIVAAAMFGLFSSATSHMHGPGGPFGSDQVVFTPRP